jgi:TRAP-type mannitol/chloroaromatic compound transport system substrate-binding protein
MRLKCGGFADETLKAWGAVPVQLKHGDMYLAMQRGVVDGIVFPLGAAKSFKLEEVTKYVFKTDFFSYHLFMGMNLDTWNVLPKELQEAVMRASARAGLSFGISLSEHGWCCPAGLSGQRRRGIRARCGNIGRAQGEHLRHSRKTDPET